MEASEPKQPCDATACDVPRYPSASNNESERKTVRKDKSASCFRVSKKCRVSGQMIAKCSTTHINLADCSFDENCSEEGILHEAALYVEGQEFKRELDNMTARIQNSTVKFLCCTAQYKSAARSRTWLSDWPRSTGDLHAKVTGNRRVIR